MGTLLESKEALRARALEVNLSKEEIDAVIGNGVNSLARLALDAAPPGTTPAEQQVTQLFGEGLLPMLVRLHPWNAWFLSLRRLW